MNGSECHSVNANECECECVCTLRLKVLSSPCSRRELVDFRYKVVGVVVVVDTYLRNQTTKIVEMKRTNNRTRAKVNVSSQRFIVVSVANKTNKQTEFEKSSLRFSVRLARSFFVDLFLFFCATCQNLLCPPPPLTMIIKYVLHTFSYLWILRTLDTHGSLSCLPAKIELCKH